MPKRLFARPLLTLAALALYTGLAMAQHHPEQPPHAPATTDTVQHPSGVNGHAPATHSPETHAPEAHQPEAFDAAQTILHHVQDTHDWHFLDLPQGNGAYVPVAIHLPWILYSSRDGLLFFANTEALHHEGRYMVQHDKVFALKPGAALPAEAHGHGAHADVATLADTGVSILDFSPTKTVVQLFLVLVLVVAVFANVAAAYRKNAGKAPKGLQSLMEPIILFVRDEVARPHLKHRADAFAPYLLSLFFMIWFSNVLGLMPINSNIMGNISVTCALATLTFVLIQVNGTKDYWMHMVWMPGTPVFIRPLLAVIEIMSMFIKPVALMIRLFANISAGHFMVLALICLIFIMGKGGESIAGAAGIAPVSILLTLFIFSLETLVTIIQAYIFTLLTAIFIGMALESHDHGHGHEDAAHS